MLQTTDATLLDPFTPAEPPWRRLLRPAIGYADPLDVLKDPDLDTAEKRAVLSSWASDANAPPSEPTRRRLPGSEEAVPLADILDALRRLDS